MFYLKNANLVLCNGKASTTGCDFVRRLSGNREMAIASFVPKLDGHYSLQPALHTPCNIVHSCYYCNNKKNKNHFILHRFTDISLNASFNFHHICLIGTRLFTMLLHHCLYGIIFGMEFLML